MIVFLYRAICCVRSSRGRSHRPLLFLYLHLWYLRKRAATSALPTSLCFHLHAARLEVQEKVWQAEMIHLYLPADGGGNRNTPCMWPVKRQFPRDTPQIPSFVVLSLSDTHTLSHLQRSFRLICLTVLEPGTCSRMLQIPLFIKAVLYVCGCKHLCIIVCACVHTI